jgi:hypothetical protein
LENKIEKFDFYSIIKGILDKIYLEMEENSFVKNYACNKCGKCCDFFNSGHVLYLSFAEAVFMLKQHTGTENRTPGDFCPYLVNSKCINYHARAIGCRSYFCKGLDTDIEDLSFAMIQKLRKECQNNGIPWLYGASGDLIKIAAVILKQDIAGEVNRDNFYEKITCLF